MGGRQAEPGLPTISVTTTYIQQHTSNDYIYCNAVYRVSLMGITHKGGSHRNEASSVGGRGDH